MMSLRNKKTLTYTIKFNKNLQINKNQAIKKIKSVLEDTRGWKSLGYNFIYIDINNKNNNNKHPTDFVIYFTSSQYVKKICNDSRLSCANMENFEIYFNIDRWRYGSKLSKLKIDDYRTYVINHEVGHIIGRDHDKCKGRNFKVPVMVQQTLGIGNCKPNPWPLKFE